MGKSGVDKKKIKRRKKRGKEKARRIEGERTQRGGERSFNSISQPAEFRGSSAEVRRSVQLYQRLSGSVQRRIKQWGL